MRVVVIPDRQPGRVDGSSAESARC
jgi:hypothetical protein